MADRPPQLTVEELSAVPRASVGSFDRQDAIALGQLATDVIMERRLSLAVDVCIGGDRVFHAKLGTTDASNERWLAGKAQTARAFGEPSLLVRRRLEAGAELQLTEGMKAHGGSIPIFVDGQVVATITMSGEPDHVDHEVCATAVERFLATKV